MLTIDKLDDNTINQLRQVAKSIQNASQPIKGLPIEILKAQWVF